MSKNISTKAPKKTRCICTSKPFQRCWYPFKRFANDSLYSITPKNIVDGKLFGEILFGEIQDTFWRDRDTFWRDRDTIQPFGIFYI